MSTRLVYNILNPKSKDFVLLKKLGSLMNTVSGEEGGSTIDLISVIEELCPDLKLFKFLTDKFLDRAKQNRGP